MTTRKDKLSKLPTLDRLIAKSARNPAFRQGQHERSRVLEAAKLMRAIRIGAGLTQTQLAERMNIPQAQISRLEAGVGRRGPTVDMLARISEACSSRLVLASVPMGEVVDRKVLDKHLQYLVELD